MKRYYKEIKKILVLRNDRIGDLVLSLPALSALRRSYPSAHIGILTQAYTRDILWNNPDIDEIIIDDGQNVFELARQIAKKRFDLAVILYPSWRNGWLCVLSRIPLRIGTGYKLVGILFNERVYIHRTKVICHEIDYCLELARKAGARAKREEIRLWIKEEDREYAKRLIEKYQLSYPLIGLHPGSGGSALNWTEGHYAQLIDALEERYKTRVILTGSKEDELLIERIISLTSRKPINLAGKTSLGQLMAIFSFYHLLIAPSTGPMHLAAGLGKPVIALFPPLPSQSPAKWGPLGENHTVLMPEKVKCQHRHCQLQKCKFYNCMEQITPSHILEVVKWKTEKLIGKNC